VSKDCCSKLLQRRKRSKFFNKSCGNFEDQIRSEVNSIKRDPVMERLKKKQGKFSIKASVNMQIK
jgi:hypothetical protein